MGETGEIKVNTKIYPLEAVMLAANYLQDKAYFFVDGDPEKTLTVKYRKKKDFNEDEFHTQLNSFCVYLRNADEPDISKFEDPEDIAIPWEEKYGKDSNP